MHTTCIILCGLCSGLMILYLTRNLHDCFLDKIDYNNNNGPGIHVRNPPVTSQRQVTWRFDVFFDMRLNKWLCEHSRRRKFETQSRSLWRHCDEWLIWKSNYLGNHNEMMCRKRKLIEEIYSIWKGIENNSLGLVGKLLTFVCMNK